MFISDPKGNRLFIGVDVRASGEDKNPTILFDPATEMIMNINMNVRTDTNGNFIQVQKGNKWISREEWNKQYSSKNPNP